MYVGTSQAGLYGNTIQRNIAKKWMGYAGLGGGVFLGADATLINNIVTDNVVEGLGSGLIVVGASPGLYHTTIANNTGGDGSGIYVQKNSSDQPGQPTLHNTIVASQTLGVNVSDDSAQNLATLYGVLWWGNTETITGTAFAFDEVEDDPAFVDPAGYDYHIDPGSAAIDAGRTDAGITDDVDGQARPHYEGYDLGADEAWAVVAAKTVAPDVAEPGDVVTYTLALTNTTGAAMTVRLTDTLPLYVSLTGTVTTVGGGTLVYTPRVITWTGTVLTATPVLITWPVQVAPDVPPSTTIPNTATVRDAYGLFHTDPAVILVPPAAPAWRFIYLPLVLRNA